MKSGRVGLVFVSILALALMGVPFLLRVMPSSGEISGLVIDGRGFGVADAAVYLFSEESKSLVEEVRTDGRGHFFLHLGASRPRVLVRPPAGSALAATWGPSGQGGAHSAPLEFVLGPAQPLTVHVADEHGAPLQGAEVRVYERRRESAVVALAQTDASGMARLQAPTLVDVAVFAPGDARLVRWRFQCETLPEGTELSFVLPTASLLRGRVSSARGNLEGIVVVAWEEDVEGGWNGFARSDAEGFFELPVRAAPTVLRALDPRGAFLPTALELHEHPEGELRLTLEEAAHVIVHVRSQGSPLPARVWSWTPGSESWSWGVETDADGHARLPVANRFGIHAEPLDSAYRPLLAWDMTHSEQALILEAEH